MSKWRFVPWDEVKPKQIREKDLPPGVRYSFGHAAEWISATDCDNLVRVQVRLTNGKPVCDACGLPRGHNAVTILDWPAHCGPRPDQEREFTYADIAKYAPSQGARTVWLIGDLPCVGAAASHYADGAMGIDTFLGYWVKEGGAA